MGAYDDEAARYLRDVSAYVHYVKAVDRRVFVRPDLWDGRFDQRHDEGLPFRNPTTRHQWQQAPAPTWLEHVRRWWRHTG